VLARALTEPLVAIEWTEADDLASQPGAAAPATPVAGDVPTAH
jgi:ATP-dependent Lon protease